MPTFEWRLGLTPISILLSLTLIVTISVLCSVPFLVWFIQTHVFIQKPKYHLCVYVTAITMAEFWRATNKTNEREGVLCDSSDFFYCAFMRFFLLMARRASRSWQYRALKYSMRDLEKWLNPTGTLWQGGGHLVSESYSDVGQFWGT